MTVLLAAIALTVASFVLGWQMCRWHAHRLAVRLQREAQEHRNRQLAVLAWMASEQAQFEREVATATVARIAFGNRSEGQG